MRRGLFAFTVLFLGLAFAPTAKAQVPVIDAANLAQTVQTAAQSIIAVEQLKAQLTQLEETYQMFTSPTDILNMASGMENQAIENPMPDANALSTLVGGQTAPAGAAAKYYNQNHVYTPTADSSESIQLNANANAISNIEGIAATNLSAVEQRLQELPDLETDLNGATSITQVSAINGRIAAESQFVQGQQAQAENLQVLATEQQNSQQQQQQEQFQEDAVNSETEMQQAAALNSEQP